MIPSGRDHAIELHSESDLICLYLEKEWAMRIVPHRLTHISVEPLDHYIGMAPIIGELAAVFRHECSQPQNLSKSALLETLGCALAAHLLWTQFSTSERQEPRYPTLTISTLDRLKNYIESNLEKNLSLSVLARLAGLSPSYFGQLFRVSTGLSPHAYVTQRRVLRAKELIATGNYRIAEVSDLVGFTEPHRMNYHFRRILNTYPGAYLPMSAGPAYVVRTRPG